MRTGRKSRARLKARIEQRNKELREKNKLHSMTVTNKHLLQLIEDQDGICHYCKSRMKVKSDKPYDENMATIEHIYPKFDIRRLINESTVAACRCCNHKKAVEDEQDIFKRYPPLGYKHYKNLVKKILNNEETTQWFKN